VYWESESLELLEECAYKACFDASCASFIFDALRLKQDLFLALFIPFAKKDDALLASACVLKSSDDIPNMIEPEMRLIILIWSLEFVIFPKSIWRLACSSLSIEFDAFPKLLALTVDSFKLSGPSLPESMEDAEALGL